MRAKQSGRWAVRAFVAFGFGALVLAGSPAHAATADSGSLTVIDTPAPSAGWHGDKIGGFATLSDVLWY